MASVTKEIQTRAQPKDVWDAIRDIGALHTRLVPGFVTNTTLELGVRVVTFGNSMVVREPIITVDEAAMRLVWSAEGGRATHYNASVQVFANPDNSSRIVWTSDFLPEAITDDINAAMSAGASVMKITLDKLA